MKLPKFLQKKEKNITLDFSQIYGDFFGRSYKHNFSYAQFITICNESYNINPNVQHCVDLIANAVAEVPFKLVNSKGEEAELNKIPELQELLENQYKKIVRELIVNYYIGGEFFILKTWGKGIDKIPQRKLPKKIYSVRPDFVSKIKFLDGEVDEFEVDSSFFKENGWVFEGVEKYIFTSFFMNETKTNSILQFKKNNPINEKRGLSFLVTLSNDIQILNQGKVWNRSLLENSGRPSGILYYPPNTMGSNLSIKGGLSTKSGQTEKIEEDIRSKLAGGKNAGRVMFLRGGLKFEKISESLKDVDFLDGQKFSKNEIASLLGIPTQLIGDNQSSTFNNLQTAKELLFIQTVNPLASKILNAISSFLIHPHISHDLNLVIAKEKLDIFKEKELMLYKEIDNITFLTINEKRLKCGLEKITSLNADIPLVQSSLKPLDDLDLNSDDEEEVEDDDAENL